MAIYIDNFRGKYGRMTMCHMIADSLQELHGVAKILGLEREWFRNDSWPHYDISLSKRATAVRKGAIEVSPEEMVVILTRRYGAIEQWQQRCREEEAH